MHRYSKMINLKILGKIEESSVSSHSLARPTLIRACSAITKDLALPSVCSFSWCLPSTKMFQYSFRCLVALRAGSSLPLFHMESACFKLRHLSVPCSSPHHSPGKRNCCPLNSPSRRRWRIDLPDTTRLPRCKTCRSRTLRPAPRHSYTCQGRTSHRSSRRPSRCRSCTFLQRSRCRSRLGRICRRRSRRLRGPGWQ